MDPRAQPVLAPDGRTLMVAEWGDPEGAPIITCHGTPGCRLNRHPDQERVRRLGAHVLTYDRPGYGRSDRQPGRTIADAAADIAAIADAFGFGQFAVTGGSGGGPHALACAALLGDRITRAAAIVSVAPYDLLGEQWYDGMDPENVKEFGWAIEGESVLAAELEREAAEMQARVTDDPSKILGDNWQIGESDRAHLARPELGTVIREATQEMFRNGVWGWVDDDIAETRPWGFDVTSITVPTGISYGTADVLVPPIHGRWLAEHVPGAVVRVDTTGHQPDFDTFLEIHYAWLIHGKRWD